MARTQPPRAMVDTRGTTATPNQKPRDSVESSPKLHWSGLGGVAESEADLRVETQEAEFIGRYSEGLAGVDLAIFVLGVVGTKLWRQLPIPHPGVTAKGFEAINVNVTPERLTNRYMGCQMSLALDGESIVVRDFSYDVDGNIGSRTP